MKLLLDEGLPYATVDHLKAAGIDSVHTHAIGLNATSDHLILERSRIEDWVIVTLDADFHALMAKSGARKPSVIRIRIEGLKGKELAALLLDVISDCGAQLIDGALVSVREAGTRVRRLPLA